MSSRKTKSKTTKKRAQRATSNVFAMFDQAQIQEFKEAFNMIDQNRDGFIDKEDLADMLASLGRILLWTLEDHIFPFSYVFLCFFHIFLDFITDLFEVFIIYGSLFVYTSCYINCHQCFI